MNMKKPVLGAIGVAGACAACCAVPLAIPMIAGMSAGGLASVIGWDGLALSAIFPVGAGLAAALLGKIDSKLYRLCCGLVGARLQRVG